MQTEQANRIAPKLIYLLKRFTDEWIDRTMLCGQCYDFNNAHLPLLMSIGPDGITNSELAEKLNVSKQATSKTIQALEANKLVETEKSAADARVAIIRLTKDGQDLSQKIWAELQRLEEQYKKLVGAKKYETAIDVMLQLISFHEQQNCKG